MRLTRYIPFPFHMMDEEAQHKLVQKIRFQRKVTKASTPRKRAISKQAKKHGSIKSDVAKMTPEQLQTLADRLKEMEV